MVAFLFEAQKKLGIFVGYLKTRTFTDIRRLDKKMELYCDQIPVYSYTAIT